MSNLLNNTTGLQEILDALQDKVAGGVELPTLATPAAASDILSGKEAIDEKGEIITGTILTKTANDLTASGATVTVPAGYYASQATKSVSSGSAKTPATTITKAPTISVNSSGLISASVSGTQSVTPAVTAGYVSSGTSGTITISGSATKQLTTQAAKTVTPTTSSQTAVASGVYTTGAVTVGPIPSNYEDVGTETTEYTSLNAELEEVINSLPDAGGGSGDGWESSVQTYDLIFQSDGTITLDSIEYVTYADGQFEWRMDYTPAVTYPAVFSNVVLKTPVIFSFTGGASPYAELVSNIEHVPITSYNGGNFATSVGVSEGMFLPLTSENDQVIISLCDDF